MDQVTTVRKRINQENWKTLISECQSSGMTVRAWCKAHDIREQTYYRNLRRLREELLPSLPTTITKSEPEEPMVFQKLEVATPVQNTQAAVILHLSNATLEILEGTSKQTIQAVLLALQNVC